MQKTLICSHGPWQQPRLPSRVASWWLSRPEPAERSAKIGDQTGIQNKWLWNPGTLLRTITLPVHQILPPPSGLNWEMWNLGGILQDAGSFSHTGAGLMMVSISYGPTKQEANLREGSPRGMSLVGNHTFCPGMPQFLACHFPGRCCLTWTHHSQK